MSEKPDDAKTPYCSSRWPARLLMATGTIHNVVGLLIPEIRRPLMSAIRAGYVNQFDSSYARGNAFWFMLAGFQMILSAHFMNVYLFGHLRRRRRVSSDANTSSAPAPAATVAVSDRSLPRSIGAWLVGIGVSGIVAMPASGFYLLVAQGAAILMRL
ncbi:hypothetical protein BGZ73_008545 [Actinomortierella ambigua]|nr:hypothetical protein BGZ73_008545 [Actinomortierella ambigua]